MARVPRSAQSRFIALREDRRFVLQEDRLVDTKRNELYPWGLPNHVTVEFGTLGRSSPGEVAGAPKDGRLRFTPDGLPADDESAQALAHEVEPWLFVVDGRLRPASSAAPASNAPEDWEQMLRHRGLGDPDTPDRSHVYVEDVDALRASRVGHCSEWQVGLDEPAPKPATVFTCSERRWRETLIARVATLFDQSAGGLPLASCTTDGATSCEVGPLDNGTTYYVGVVALNGAGVSPSSSPRVAVRPTGPPSVEIASISPGATSLTVDVTTDDGGSPLSTYEFRLDGGEWISAVTTTEPFTISGLVTGRAYVVEVRAVNGVGPGPASGPVSATPRTGRPSGRRTSNG